MTFEWLPRTSDTEFEKGVTSRSPRMSPKKPCECWGLCPVPQEITSLLYVAPNRPICKQWTKGWYMGLGWVSRSGNAVVTSKKVRNEGTKPLGHSD